MGIDDYTGNELNMLEANLSRKMRAGDATPAEIQKFNMVAMRMGNVNVPLERARAKFTDITGYTPATKQNRRSARRAPTAQRQKKGKQRKRK